MISAVTILVFVLYGAFFMPTRQELRNYLDGGRTAKQPGTHHRHDP